MGNNKSLFSDGSLNRVDITLYLFYTDLELSFISMSRLFSFLWRRALTEH